MSDKDILENYLLILKSTVEVYVHGTLESSNSIVRATLKECLNDTISNQANTYDLMKQNGWYCVDNISFSAINETLIKLKNN